MSISTAWRRVLAGVAVVVLLSGSLAVAIPARAATIRQIGTNELLSGSQLIFHGQVIETWSEAGAAQGSIVTKVVLQITDVIKGEYADSTIMLTFLGGTLGELRQHIDGSNLPRLGEEGIYFLEDPERFLINPMYGWTQGHFVVAAEDRHVRTFAGQPVYGLRAQDGPSALEFAHGHASGVMTELTALRSRPLSVDEFKAQLRSLTEGLQ